jgi:hypothetical protein
LAESQLPVKALAMPMRVVPMRPPGSRPGRRNLAMAPARIPRTIQLMMPMT